MNFKAFFLVSSIFFMSSVICAQGDWKFRKEKSGIQAFTRTQENSKFDEYRVETITEGSLASFYHLIKDFETYYDLFEDTKEVIIHENKPDRHTIYIHTNAPFPARDRDGVMENIFEYDDQKKILTIAVTCVNKYYVPDASRIQLKDCHGSWEVSEHEPDKILIRHQFVADPGGTLPAFIINLKTVQNPIKTLQEIKKRITLPQYQGLSLPLN